MMEQPKISPHNRLVEIAQRVAQWWNTPVKNYLLFPPEKPGETTWGRDMGADIAREAARNRQREIDATLHGYSESAGISVDDLRDRFQARTDALIYERVSGVPIRVRDGRYSLEQLEEIQAGLSAFAMDQGISVEQLRERYARDRDEAIVDAILRGRV